MGAGPVKPGKVRRRTTGDRHAATVIRQKRHAAPEGIVKAHRLLFRRKRGYPRQEWNGVRRGGRRGPGVRRLDRKYDPFREFGEEPFCPVRFRTRDDRRRRGARAKRSGNQEGRDGPQRTGASKSHFSAGRALRRRPSFAPTSSGFSCPFAIAFSYRTAASSSLPWACSTSPRCSTRTGSSGRSFSARRSPSSARRNSPR